MAGETGKLFPFNNVGLFSDHFLTKRLPAESPCGQARKPRPTTFSKKILAHYKKFKSTYKAPNEDRRRPTSFVPFWNCSDMRTSFKPI